MRQEKQLYNLKTLQKELREIEQRQELGHKQHEDDLNGVIANHETGQTAEEEAFGIMPSLVEDIAELPVQDDYKEDRFKILDL